MIGLAILAIFVVVFLFIMGGGFKRGSKSIGVGATCGELNGECSATGKCPPETCSKSGGCGKLIFPKVTKGCGDGDGESKRCCVGLG